MRPMEFKNLLSYLAGLSVAFSYDDLSNHKNATQSHTSPGFNMFKASLAVDGNKSTCMRTLEIGLNSQFKRVWWKVDLGGVYNIYSVGILFRNYDGQEDRQRGRVAGFSLYVSKTGNIEGSTMCYKDGPPLPPLNFTTTCTEYGRYVIFYNERLDRITYPEEYEEFSVFSELCEVVVLGCDTPGVYGSRCNNSCPVNCKNKRCHIQHGTCYECKPGWVDKTCSKNCAEGWYGVNCTQKCVGHCRDGTTCNHVTGNCDMGCDAGWIGSFCDKECNDGTYGYYCSGYCSSHCMNGSPCNKQTGYCDSGCNPGYNESDCSKHCPSGYFGMACSARCIGHCSGNEPCDHVSGRCPGGCQDGYLGQYCNESCAKGYYGRQCLSVCSPNCKTCQHTDGVCTCKAGWTGLNCTTECVGSFGENCQYQCSVHCFNQTCDRFNGSCVFGCKETCDLEIVSWHFKTSHRSSVKMVAFIIAPIIGIIIFVSLIILWKKLIQKKICTYCVQRRFRPKSNPEKMNVTTDESHYQELGSIKEENTYQTLKISVN